MKFAVIGKFLYDDVVILYEVLIEDLFNRVLIAVVWWRRNIWLNLQFELLMTAIDMLLVGNI